MYGATGEAPLSRRADGSQNDGSGRSSAWRVALGLGVIALAGSLSVRRMSTGTPSTETAMAASSALAPRSAFVPDQQEYGGQGGRPFKITTALGEFYFVADTEGISGMEPTIFQYLPNDFSGDAVTPIGGVLKRSLIPEFLCYCAKKVFFTTASKVRLGAECGGPPS